MPARPAGALVLFGITGDLAKKLVLPALYRLEERGDLDQPIIGVARSDWHQDDLVRHAREAVEDALGKPKAEVFSRLADRLSYVQGEYDDSRTFDRVKQRVGPRASSAVYYLAVPPPVFAVVAEALAREGLNKQSRLVVEKPFGHDLSSAKALDQKLRQFFPEERLFRVDHFLGKESVEDLLVFRFANGLFEQVWNRDHVQSVQLTFAENLDVADRGGFYDPVGAIRDVVQNHLFQVLAYLAMDSPSGSDPEAEQRERTRLLRAVRTLSKRNVVRGQYDGYRKVEGVKANSTTETYVAMRMAIDNARWEGVPFYVRTGKCLPETILQAVVELKPAPRLPQLERHNSVAPNLIRLRMQPSAGITLDIQAKEPGPGYRAKTVPLSVDFERTLGPTQLAYERVVSDALSGSRIHFTSQEAVEQSWRIVDPVLDLPDLPVSYKPGTWGPEQAERLPGREGWIRVDTDI
ncbi:MAG: glucose-6-phosphate dehydrogenase [Acidimicrobiaceae bacterium]|nr:glucose-6-phosphate dehydrogenase [Acidimicrobiaceae bacterium]